MVDSLWGATKGCQVCAGLGAGEAGRVLGAATLSGEADCNHSTAPKIGSKEWTAFFPEDGGMIAKAMGPKLSLV